MEISSTEIDLLLIRGIGTILFLAGAGPLCVRSKFAAHTFISVRGVRLVISENCLDKDPKEKKQNLGYLIDLIE